MTIIKKQRKLVTIALMVTFFFYSGISMPTQENSGLQQQFERAITEYNDGNYLNSKSRLKNIIGTITAKKMDSKDILGKCYLLEGAIYEQEGDTQSAEKYYLKAKTEYGIKFIEGVDLTTLVLYKSTMLDKRVIEQPTRKKKKKKFPVLLVIGGVVVVAAVLVLLLSKKKEKEYTLTVNVGEGVEGTPASGPQTYKEGDTVNYNYSLSPGYNTLTVALDGNEVSSSGTITMGRDHILSASASANDVSLVLSTDTIEIPEGGSTSVNISLSAQPAEDINVYFVKESGGDFDISILSDTPMTFTTSNWNNLQTITFAAKEDGDEANGQAAFLISSPGLLTKSITATEVDNDIPSPPTVLITTPNNGAVVSGTVTITAQASGQSRIRRVEFYIDGGFLDSDSSFPYQIDWDTSSNLNGPHTIKAIVHDREELTASHQIQVTVSN